LSAQAPNKHSHSEGPAPALALSGPICAGKSTVASLLAKASSRKVISFGRYVSEEATARGVKSDRSSLQKLGTRLLQEHGPRAFCESALRTCGATLGSDLVWDGVRHPSVFLALKELHQSGVLLIYLDPPSAARRARALRAAGSESTLSTWETDETESHHRELIALSALHCRAGSPEAAAAEILNLHE
jgi:dephospho-CoA kinase